MNIITINIIVIKNSRYSEGRLVSDVQEDSQSRQKKPGPPGSGRQVSSLPLVRNLQYHTIHKSTDSSNSPQLSRSFR